MQKGPSKSTLILWVLTILAIAWVALEVRWTRQAMPEGMDYSTHQMLRSMADDLANIARQSR